MPLPSQIKPGGIVLTRGTGWISRAICLLDDSPVSHALIAHRDGKLAETVGEGLQTITFDDALKDHDVLVARALADPTDMSPVSAVADAYLQRGARYAHQQIVLLAILCLTRRVPLPGGGRGMVRAVLDQAAAALNSMAERGQQPMICSEFVYRCYREAQPEAPYALKIGTDDARTGAPVLLDWAQAHPALGFVARSGGLSRFDPAAAEKALAPLIAAHLAATGKTLPGGAATTASADPEDKELLAGITAFGTALHRANNPGNATPRPSADEALNAIRATHAEPNFVTPGDLARTGSLTETHRWQATTTPLKAAAQLLGH